MNLMNFPITGESNKPCIFPPFFGEFGIMIYHYIKFVHFYKCPKKIIMCPREERCFYPSSDEFIDYPISFGRPHFYNLMIEKDKDIHNPGFKGPTSASLYKNLSEIAKGLKPECKVVLFNKFLSRNMTDIHFDLNVENNKTPNFDISIGSRGKDFFNIRNYSKWEDVIKSLSIKNSKIVLVGKKDSSYEIPGTIPSWYFGNESSYVVSALKNSKIYVGTDSGITHLACFLQIPTILLKFSKEVNYKMGRFGEKDQGMISELMSINKNFIKLSDNWNHPEKLAGEIEEYLESKNHG